MQVQSNCVMVETEGKCSRRVSRGQLLAGYELRRIFLVSPEDMDLVSGPLTLVGVIV